MISGTGTGGASKDIVGTVKANCLSRSGEIEDE